jgi:hypothetical protein
MAIELMHGTCKCLAAKINIMGLLANTHYTDSAEVASYYAECAEDECDCGGQEIVHVSVPNENLKPDFHSYEEPLSFFRNEYTTCDREWHEMIETGEIPFPLTSADYKTSLDEVRSVVSTQAVSHKRIPSLESIIQL